MFCSGLFPARRFVAMSCLVLSLGAPLILPVGAQSRARETTRSPNAAPLALSKSGSGRVIPFQNGQLLLVGHDYSMTALPSRGWNFAGWSRVRVFTIIDIDIDGMGSSTTNAVVSPVSGLTRTRTLKFQVQPPEVIFNIPEVRMITVSFGWQANFVQHWNEGHIPPLGE